MAAISYNAAHQKEHVREQLQIVLIAFREMLDVSNRMRRTAAQARHVRARQFLARHRRR
jgi:hypothetical protein